MKYLVIDGYNAISKIKQFDAKKDISLEASRLTFIKALMDSIGEKGEFNKIIVVFDGKSQGIGTGRQSYGRVEILFTKDNKDADTVIIDILKVGGSKDRLTVSSDDNFVKNHARAFGADIMSIRQLEDLISLKRKTVKSKIIEKDIDYTKLKDITNELKKHWGVK